MDGATSATMAMMGIAPPPKRAPPKAQPPQANNTGQQVDPAEALIAKALGAKEKEKETPQGTRIIGSRMDLPYAIHLRKSGVDEDLLRGACDKVFDVAYETFSPAKYNPSSEVARINDLPVDGVANVSPEMAEVLRCVQFVNRATQGLFDPSVDHALRLWEAELRQRKSNGTHSAFSPDAFAVGLKERSISTGWKYTFSFDATQRTIRKLKEGSMDLSGVAKGWTVDKLHSTLTRLYGDGVFAEWGGEIRASGKHPEGRQWQVTVVPPPGVDDTRNEWGLSNASVATSGDYGSVLAEAGPGDDSYAPILSPKTHKPVSVTQPNSCASVTVSCDSCMHADAFATALMCMASPDEAVEFARSSLQSHVRRVYACDRGGRAAEWIAPVPTTAKPAPATAPPSAPAPEQPRQPPRLRDVTRSIPHAVHLLRWRHPTGPGEVSVAADSVVDLSAGHLAFNAAKDNILGAYCRIASENRSKRMTIIVLPMPGAAACVQYMQEVGADPTLPLPGTSHPAGELHCKAVCEMESVLDCGDHYAVLCNKMSMLGNRPGSVLLTASLRGRYYASAASPHAVAPLALAQGTRGWCVVSHLNSLSADPEMLQFTTEGGGGLKPADLFVKGDAIGVSVLSMRDGALLRGASGGVSSSPRVRISSSGGSVQCTVSEVRVMGGHAFVTASVGTVVPPPSPEVLQHLLVDASGAPVVTATLADPSVTVLQGSDSSCGSPVNALRKLSSAPAKQVPQDVRRPVWQCA